MNLERLKALILEHSYQRKTIRLSSGKMSDFYFDGKQTTLHPEGAYLVGEAMWERIRERFPNAAAVGGPTLGADPIVTAIAVVSHLKQHPLHAFIVRKEPKGHGTQNWIEGVKHLRPGMPVVLVEDVITTGGSLLKAVGPVREAGLEILGALVLVDREDGGAEKLREQGITLEALFRKSELH